MRELKFKAWSYWANARSDNYKMLSSGDITKCGSFNSADFPFEVDGEFILDIMQYIGYKDEEGIEIYERDIVERTDFTPVCGAYGAKVVGVVEYAYGQYVLKTVDGDSYAVSADVRMRVDKQNVVIAGYKVIGNVYQTKYYDGIEYGDKI